MDLFCTKAAPSAALGVTIAYEGYRLGIMYP